MFYNLISLMTRQHVFANVPYTWTGKPWITVTWN